MRRPLLIALIAALLGGLAITTVSLAGGDDQSATKQQRGWAAYMHAGDRDRAAHGGEAYLGSLAARLDVTPRALKAALTATARRQLDRAVRSGLITRGERGVLRACVARQGRRCDGRTLRRTAKRLKRAVLAGATTAELAELKRTIGEDLGAELDKPAADVLAAIRAELVARLGQGVAMGLVTERGRELALGCFDDPSQCDVRAVRKELRFG